MKYILSLLAMLLSAGLPKAATAADELVVSRADVIRPDAELLKTVRRLHTLAAKGRKRDIAKVEAFFARDVRSFTRGLDPFKPWHRIDDLTSHYLDGVAGVMVEQGEVEAGRPIPDYRLDAMTLVASLVSGDATFGTLPEAPGAACAPAAYSVDRRATAAFARRFELDAYSLRFFREGVFLADKPKGKKGEHVPANTLIMFDHDPKAPKGWALYETAGGAKGYMQDRDDTVGLSQQHVCFAKVGGEYRITAVFGYGL